MTLLLAWGLVQATLGGADFVSPAARTLTWTAALVLAGHGLSPTLASRTGPAILWWLLLGLTALAAGFLQGEVLPRVAVAAMLLAALLDGLARCWPGPGGRQWSLLLAVLVGSAPLWAAPGAEGLGPGAVGGLVSVSPLSYLAVAVGYDYLRSQWFYVHSPLGSLPYDYPGFVATSIVYLILGLTLQAAGRCRRAQPET